MTLHPVSPNTVLANALTSAEDVLTPRILTTAPERIVFVVGTQINGAPHIGTSLVQSLTFAAAARIRDRLGFPVEVMFTALDNAPYEIVTDPATGHRYQRTYAQALGTQGIVEQVDTLYRPLFAERRPPAVRLGVGEWVRWQINHRLTSSSGDYWAYRLDTLNLAYGPVEADVFLGGPTYFIDERAPLR